MIEIKSDMMGYIQNINQKLSADRANTVVDELVQNCKRAGAKNVDITLYARDTLTIQDDGIGCDDLQDLFCSNHSGWKNVAEAFGQGFFSVFSIADEIEVISTGGSIFIDVDDILNNGQFSFNEDKTKTRNGFYVKLKGESIRKNATTIKDYVKNDLCCHDNSINYSFNGEHIDYIDVHEHTCNKSTWAQQYEQDDVKFTMTPQTSYCNGVDVYADCRFVERSYDLPYCGGILSVGSQTLTLKAPDRKDIISDDKWYNLERKLVKQVVKMYTNMLKNASDDTIDKYADAISYHVERDVITDYLSLNNVVFDPNDLSIFNIDEDDEEEKEQPASDWLAGSGNIVFSEQEINAMDFAAEYIENHEESVKKKVGSFKAFLEELKSKNLPVTYVMQSDVKNKKMVEKINNLRYDGWTVLVAPNKLYREAFNDFDIRCLSALDTFCKKEITYDNTDPKTNVEKRFIELMQQVIEHFGMNEDSIKVCDITEKSVYDGRNVYEPRHNKKFMAAYSFVDGCIYVDRKNSRINEYEPSAVGEKTMSVGDWQMIIGTSKTMCHELAHALLGTIDATTEHEAAQQCICFEYAKIFNDTM